MGCHRTGECVCVCEDIEYWGSRSLRLHDPQAWIHPLHNSHLVGHSLIGHRLRHVTRGPSGDRPAILAFPGRYYWLRLVMLFTCTVYSTS